MSTKIIEEISPSQCRAGRALLEITQTKLATSAGLGLSTVVDFEKERRQVSPNRSKQSVGRLYALASNSSKRTVAVGECVSANASRKVNEVIGASKAFWQNEAKIFNDISTEFIDKNGGWLQLRLRKHPQKRLSKG